MHTRTVIFRLIPALVASVALIVVACDKGEEPTGSHIGDRDNILAGAAVSVSGVDGLVGGKIPIDQQVTFRIHILNGTGERISGLTDGFRLYSPDGANWTQTNGQASAALLAEDLFAAIVTPFSTDGRAADTLGLAAFKVTETGMSAGFDDEALLITVGPIASSSAGKSLCVDSSFYRPGNSWQWITASSVSGRPTWSGPHCYQIGQ